MNCPWNSWILTRVNILAKNREENQSEIVVAVDIFSIYLQSSMRNYKEERKRGATGTYIGQKNLQLGNKHCHTVIMLLWFVDDLPFLVNFSLFFHNSVQIIEKFLTYLCPTLYKFFPVHRAICKMSWRFSSLFVWNTGKKLTLFREEEKASTFCQNIHRCFT